MLLPEVITENANIPVVFLNTIISFYLFVYLFSYGGKLTVISFTGWCGNMNASFAGQSFTFWSWAVCFIYINYWLWPMLESELKTKTRENSGSLVDSFPPKFLPPEPDVASSDAANMECRLHRDKNTYIINGKKWWSSGEYVNGYLILYKRFLSC